MSGQKSSHQTFSPKYYEALFLIHGLSRRNPFVNVSPQRVVAWESEMKHATMLGLKSTVNFTSQNSPVEKVETHGRLGSDGN